MTQARLIHSVKILTVHQMNSKENIHINFNDSRIVYPSKFYFPSVIHKTINSFPHKGTICNDSVSFQLPEL